MFIVYSYVQSRWEVYETLGQNEGPCVCGRSEKKGQRAKESGGTESGGTLRTL